MDNPLISVIVPIYRIEKYLPACLKSLIAQSFTNFELILVNDGSPDKCGSICDGFAKNDTRIKVIHKTNGGLLSARKAGLESARGTYISFVDGDDWVDPYYLDTLVGLVRTNDADLIITGHFREFDGKIETIKPKNPGIYDGAKIENEILPKAIYSGDFCNHGISTYVWNKLFKKDLLLKVLPKVPNEIIMGEDAAITYCYLAQSSKVVISTIPLYYYRQRHDSIVKSIENPEKEYYRLSLLLNYLKINLEEVLPKYNLEKQLTYYLYSQILIRSGGLIFSKKGQLIWNPFLDVKKDSKVIVYSSGSFGQHILSTNEKSGYLNIVGWIDIDYHDLSIGNNKVQSISSILDKDFDQIIIATVNPYAFSNIKGELFLLGVKEIKIAKYKLNFNQIKKLISDLGYSQNYCFNKV